jgi:hypothetical protein
MRFKLKDTNLFYLPGNAHMLHLATIEYSLREFIAMLDVTTQKLYIEEIVLQSVDFQKDVWANLKFINDDLLAADLAEFLREKKVIDMKKIQEKILEQTRSRDRRSL